MTLHLGHLSPVGANAAVSGAPVPGTATAGVPGVAAPAPDATADVIPAVPPPDVSAQVAEAHVRAQLLYADNRELHFSKDPASNRIIVEVRDLDGNVLRTIPPSEALAVMAGEKAL
jgi:flagellar protein FlaG